MEKVKTCKICNLSEPEVEFYKNSGSKCKKCKNREDSRRRAEKAGREYIPREKVEVPEGYKLCTKCKRVLPIDDFYVLGTTNKDGTNRIYSRCKECERQIVLEHPNRKEYIEKSNKNKLEKSQEDPDYRNYLNEINKKYYHSEKGIIAHMLYEAKKRAAKKNLEFDLTEEDIILPTHCPILETEFVKGDSSDYSMTYSLDRIDNSKGYVKGNVRVISMLANSMKNSATSEQLEAFSRNILNYIKKS